MSDKRIVSSIIDETKPNMGRIYDYFLGGNHNFAVDRVQAEKILAQNPLAPKLCRLVRWFLGEAVRRLLKDGYTQFIDFAAGLPTKDHIHQTVPEGTKVVYSDIDPVTVAYGAEIIGDTPNVLYLSCDVNRPSDLLENEAVAALLDRNEKTAVGMNGITYFMEDDSLRDAFETIYNWAKKGDRLYVCDTNGMYDSASDKEVNKIYTKMGNAPHIHSMDEMAQLVGQWRPIAPGYKILEEWLDLAETPLSVAAAEKERSGGNYYGVIFEK
jgi:O-methyltransferase involved in polyketide biosynthesis